MYISEKFLSTNFEEKNDSEKMCGGGGEKKLLKIKSKKKVDYGFKDENWQYYSRRAKFRRNRTYLLLFIKSEYIK